MPNRIDDGYTPPRNSNTRQTPANRGASLMSTAIPSMTSPYAGGAGSIFRPLGSGTPGQTARNPATGAYSYVGAMPTYDLPPTTPAPTSPGGGGRGGGGGGGGGSAIDGRAIMALLNSRRPQAYAWQDLDLPDYVMPEFRAFDETRYNTAQQGLTDAVAADRTAGMNAYSDARTEMQAATAQNPFSNRAYTQNPQQSAAMQRMMAANQVPTNINQADTNQGVQADSAFGNLMSILGGVTDQSNASRMRALGGDERRLNETLDAEARGGKLSIDMAKAAAQDQWQKDAFQYGVEVANKRYDITMQEAMTNNTGRNQTSQQNTQMANDFNQNAMDTLISLMSQGGKIDPASFQQVKV